MTTKWTNLTPEERAEARLNAIYGSFADQKMNDLAENFAALEASVLNGIGAMSSQIKAYARKEINSIGFAEAKANAEKAKTELDSVIDKSDTNAEYLIATIKYASAVAGLNAFYEQESHYNDSYDSHAFAPIDVLGLRQEAVKNICLINDRLEKSAVGEVSILRRIDQLEGLVFGQRSLFIEKGTISKDFSDDKETLDYIDHMLNGSEGYEGINDILADINKHTKIAEDLCKKIYAESFNRLNHNALSGSFETAWELSHMIAAANAKKAEMLDRITALLVSVRTQMFKEGDYILRTPKGDIIDPRSAKDIRSLTNELLAEGGGLLADMSSLELVRIDELKINDEFIARTLESSAASAKGIAETAKMISETEILSERTGYKADECRDGVLADLKQNNRIINRTRDFIAGKVSAIDSLLKKEKESAQNKKDIILILGSKDNAGSVAELKEKEMIACERLDEIKLSRIMKESETEMRCSARYDEWLRNNIPRGVFKNARERFINEHTYEEFKSKDRIYTAEMTKIEKDYMNATNVLSQDIKDAKRRCENELRTAHSLLQDPAISGTDFGREYLEKLNSIYPDIPEIDRHEKETLKPADVGKDITKPSRAIYDMEL